MFARVGKLWQHRDFLKFWAGETISLFGSQVTALALPLTAVMFLEASSMQMGLLGAAAFAPYLCLTLFAGVWVDRRRRRPILIMANIGRAVLLATVPILAYFGLLRFTHLVVISFLVGVFNVFFELAYQSFLPRLLERPQLVEGNSKLSISASTAEISGPGLAGLLVQLVSAPFALLLDAFSFLVSAAFLARIKTSEPREGRQRQKFVWHEMREGLEYMFRNSYLRAIAGEAATYNVFWNLIQAVLVLYVVRDIGLSAGSLGLVLSVGSAGALLGAAFTARAARRWGLGATVIGAAIISSLATLLLPFVPRATESWLPISLLSLAFFVRGVGMTGCNVHTYSLRQSIIPDALLGRTNAAYRMLTYGMIPLGSLVGGWLGTQVGLRPTLLLGASGLVLSWLWLFFSPLRSLHQLPEDPADQPAPANQQTSATGVAIASKRGV